MFLDFNVADPSSRKDITARDLFVSLELARQLVKTLFPFLVDTAFGKKMVSAKVC
jgi:hypothetical protein